ncbi:hypothetical protein NP493_1g02015 [Ridgeia piscesae]|uniref:Uncharacterized protein n=1 Tax=Ridgeia piscesae TaxID=27915 RepID=A0AAD9PGN5_RIDPI|nr:hypothetical protein NP493_1g02015 [Ridgeia piscesae]
MLLHILTRMAERTIRYTVAIIEKLISNGSNAAVVTHKVSVICCTFTPFELVQNHSARARCGLSNAKLLVYFTTEPWQNIALQPLIYIDQWLRQTCLVEL